MSRSGRVIVSTTLTTHRGGRQPSRASHWDVEVHYYSTTANQVKPLIVFLKAHHLSSTPQQQFKLPSTPATLFHNVKVAGGSKNDTLRLKRMPGRHV